ncbi:MAG: ATP-binding protein [Planctomycetes bacterium]|nr:ATP-binding protein [Planctomycetota bacterium]
MTASVELRVRGSLDHLRLVWQAGETLLENLTFAEDPESARYNVLLAVQEMVTNVLRHAYSGRDDLPLEVRFTAEERTFQVEIRDRGPGFDPLRVETDAMRTVRESEDVEAPNEGGYGILIARMVMDELTYERRGDWNVLTMRKVCGAPLRSPVA